MKILLRVACCMFGLVGTIGLPGVGRAATMTIAITNSDGTAYSGPAWVYPVGAGRANTPILADGSFLIGGVAQRIQMTNGSGSAQTMRGTYFLSNSVVAYCFACPLDTGTFSAASNAVAGYNLFVYRPGVSPDQVTNVAYAAAQQAIVDSGVLALAAQTNAPYATNAGHAASATYADNAGQANSALYVAFAASAGAAANRLDGQPILSTVVSNSPGLMSTNLYSQSLLGLRMRRQAGRPVPMGILINRWNDHYTNAPVQPDTNGCARCNSSEDEVIGQAQWLSTNGLTQFGYNQVVVNCGAFATNRDANGDLQLKPSKYPSGITNLVAALATNHCTVGFWQSITPAAGEQSECGDARISPSTAYQDGFKIASWGVRHLWLGDVWFGHNSAANEADVRYTMEMLAAGLDAGTVACGYKKPVHLSVTWSSAAIYNIMPPIWLPNVMNGAYVNYNGHDSHTATLSEYQQLYFNSFQQFPFLNTESCTPTLLMMIIRGAISGAVDGWMTTNYTRSWVGLSCLAPMPIFLPSPLNNYPDMAIFTNATALGIMQDDLRDSGQVISSNGVSAVVSRRLVGGDVAVGLWNTVTNSNTTISIDLTNIPGVSGTTVYGLEAFSGISFVVTNTLSALVNTGGLNLYRLSAAPLPKGTTLGLTTTVVDSATNTLYYVNGILTKVLTLDQTPITSGLAAWWKLNEGSGADGSYAYDSSTNGNTGTLHGSSMTPVTNANGIVGLRFSTNSAGYISLANTASLNIASNITLSAWVSMTNLDANAYVIVGGDIYPNGYRMQMNSGKSWVLTSSGWSTGALTITNGVRTLISISVGSDGWATHYFNGLPEKTNSIAALNGASILRNLATLQDGTGSRFNGALDNIRIFNRVLTPAEHLRIWTQEK